MNGWWEFDSCGLGQDIEVSFLAETTLDQR